MNRIALRVFAALPLLTAPAVYAQPRAPDITGRVQAPPYVLPGQIPAGQGPGSLQESPPLFRIGGLPVHLWAPVPPPYDSSANRNLAADPVWSQAGPWASG
jgi:hypothetical protein